MSVWLLSNDHVAVLVRSMTENGLIESDMERTVGFQMSLSNFLAFTARYPDDEAAHASFAPLPFGVRLFEPAVLRLIESYQYQCQDRATWRGSLSERMTTLLYRELDGRAGNQGWRSMLSKLPWSIDSFTEVHPQMFQMPVVEDLEASPWF